RSRLSHGARAVEGHEARAGPNDQNRRRCRPPRVAGTLAGALGASVRPTLELLLRPRLGCNGAWKADGVHPKQDRLLNLRSCCAVLHGASDVAPERRLEPRADAD